MQKRETFKTEIINNHARQPLSFFLLESANAGLELQQEDGAMPSGHNGPWYQTETPVRNTAHWGIIFSYAFQLTNDSRFSNARRKCCDYLLSKKARPFGKAFFCRKKGKDRANNLIGQAWAMEALLEIGLQTHEDDLLQCALHVARLHSFDEKANLWRRVEIDGAEQGYCWTLNQQIMFSAVTLKLGNIAGDSSLSRSSSYFFEQFHHQIRWLAKGLPCHHICALNQRSFYHRLGERIICNWWKKQALGYMPFILYGLSLAKKWCPDQIFWQFGYIDSMVQQMLSFVLDNFPYGYLENKNSFRWAYNPAGFEIAFAFKEFKDINYQRDISSIINQLIKLQIKGYFCNRKKLMCINTCDPILQPSRIYESARLINKI